jgi:hypothetical protein
VVVSVVQAALQSPLSIAMTIALGLLAVGAGVGLFLRRRRRRARTLGPALSQARRGVPPMRE